MAEKISILIPSSSDELDEARAIIREYVLSLGVDLSFQSFEEEMSALPGEYVAPGGLLLLALVDGAVAACGAFRPCELPEHPGACEMKRVYVRPACRHLGLGRRMATELLERAREAGYASMLLDTLSHLTAARKLYASLGFTAVPRYNDNFLPGVLFMKAALLASAPMYSIELAGAEPATLGESPLWSADEQCLYYVDIAEKQVLRLDPASGALKRWQLDSEPSSIALAGGGVLAVAQRNGLWRLDTASGAHTLVAPAPFDSAKQRFNDGKPDVQGRYWIGTIDDARAPEARLYRYASGSGFASMAAGITNSNGLAWSPDQRVMYWSDTKAHEIYRLPFDGASGTIGEREVFAAFPQRAGSQSLDDYGGRPDGAAVDAEGFYWVAMFEGQRLLRLAPDGRIDRELKLPVRCPTMPTFGGADLTTLFITTAREKRPAEELAAQPWAGCVLKVKVETPGMPAHVARL